ncbi:MAG: hypothetical protein HY529_00555 [Chloroflexi bacterium]|nr:hypothetical protein [Chloroflexota bacterium]
MAPDYLIEELLDLIGGWGSEEFDLANDWVRLEDTEEKYTGHMKESEITFDIQGIDLLYNEVTFRTELKGDIDTIKIEDMKMRLIPEGPWYGATYPMYDLMKRLDDTPGLALPGLVSIRTDKPRSTESFTNLVAHELYHEFEMSVLGTPFWYLNYLLESRREHALRTSEITAIDYANKHYPIK